MPSPVNRLEGAWLDAALHFLDRQVVDVDGLLVCNVDDLEMSDDGRGGLTVTGILVGPAALWPRLSGVLGDWLGRTWHRLGSGYADHDRPYYIPLDIVRDVSSAVVLTKPRAGLLERQPVTGDDDRRRRFSDLLGMQVRDENGESMGKVLDVRLVPRAWKSAPRLELTELIVGRGRPGSLLGYDRGEFHGPWLVRRAVLRLHRHTGRLPMSSVTRIDWEDSHLSARGPLEPLSTS